MVGRVLLRYGILDPRATIRSDAPRLFFSFWFGRARVVLYKVSTGSETRPQSRYRTRTGKTRTSYPHRTVKGVNPVEDAKHFLQFSAWRVRADWLFLFFSAGRAPRFVETFQI